MFCLPWCFEPLEPEASAVEKGRAQTMAIAIVHCIFMDQSWKESAHRGSSVELGCSIYSCYAHRYEFACSGLGEEFIIIIIIIITSII